MISIHLIIQQTGDEDTQTYQVEVNIADSLVGQMFLRDCESIN